MILIDSLYISNLRYRCVPKPREVLKIKKMLSFINPEPKSPGRNIKDLNVQNDGASGL